jgi:DNA-binding response OmpR family regulator
MPSELFEHLRGLGVLIVEDSWAISRALRVLLAEVGMVIVGPVATAADAERLALERAPRVAVVDLQLRDGMAFGLIDRLRVLGVRVVVVSGFAPSLTPPVRADAILQKPCSDLELLATLRGVLAGDPSRSGLD